MRNSGGSLRGLLGLRRATETRIETGPVPLVGIDLPRHVRIVAGQRRGGCGIRTREGLPPTRFPTLLTPGSPPSANCANAVAAVAGGRVRTAVNEPQTNPKPRPAHRNPR